MKIVFLTGGTGSYYCGACMRDNALAQEIQRAGHDVTLAPMYLPLMLDEATLAGADRVPVFFGGINVFLQQKIPLFRHTPRWFDRLFNSTGLLKWAARHSHMTSAREHGAMALEMLRVDSGLFRKELDKLMEWLAVIERPDVVCLSNALLAGFAVELKRRLGTPVVTFFQGEDTFLDGLPEPYRSDCWRALHHRIRDSDLLLAPTRFYADFIGQRLQLPAAAIHVVPNGIRLDGYAPAAAPPAIPTIGYLARLNEAKGLSHLVEAFIALARDHADSTTRLRLAGTATAGDAPGLAAAREKFAAAGLTERVDWLPNLSRDEKISFLRSLSLLSVPVQYPEAFGLYVIEAMACGIPVVQPDSAAFPELIAATGGGLTVEPRNPAALARTWHTLLADPARLAALSHSARAGTLAHFSSATMATQFLRTIAPLVPARTT